MAPKINQMAFWKKMHKIHSCLLLHTPALAIPARSRFLEEKIILQRPWVMGVEKITYSACLFKASAKAFVTVKSMNMHALGWGWSHSTVIHCSYKSAAPWNSISCWYTEVSRKEKVFSLPFLTSPEICSLGDVRKNCHSVNALWKVLTVSISVLTSSICFFLIQFVFNVPTFNYHLCHLKFKVQSWVILIFLWGLY